MKRKFILAAFVAATFFSANVFADSKPDTLTVISCNVKVMREMVNNLLPQHAGSFRFELLENPGTDRFEIASGGRKIIIRGNSVNSMSVGLNYYLKYFCNTTVSWYAGDAVEMPERLPEVKGKVCVNSRCDKRFFLNYCTFGYTMPWWQWKDWERFIYWMALNGVNMPLAITGQEAVWYRVWSKFGLTDEEIRTYFTGPAHLPWHRMSELDRWQGPLPKEWLDGQEALQKKIVAMERRLGMKPVLPAFAGHVPESLKRLFPEARISRMSSWGGFADEYRSNFLSPSDSLFETIQKTFLEEQSRLFGTDHIYGVDPFNEVDPPSWKEDSLSLISKRIYQTLAAADPNAVWLQMTWIFYFDRHKWTDSRIAAFLTATPPDKMLLLDYYAENTEVWKQTQAYHGQPYLWCYLGNFGGNTMLAGNIRETGQRIENALACGGKNLAGLGATLEALDVNPFMYEYVLEKAWEPTVPDSVWIQRLADRRTGEEDPAAREAWKMLYEKIYVRPASLGQACLTNARPCLAGSGNWTTNPKTAYDNRDLLAAWEQLLLVKNKSRNSYTFDLVNTGRQVLGNYFLQLRDEFTQAYKVRNVTLLRQKGEEMKTLLSDLDSLLQTQPAFSLHKWLTDARSWGSDESSKNYYEQNARNILTTWGDRRQSLNDYANRMWAGLIAGYYRPRWELFVDDVTDATEKNRKFDEQLFHRKVTDFEWKWVESTEMEAPVPCRNVVELSARLFDKYAKRIFNIKTIN